MESALSVARNISDQCLVRKEPQMSRKLTVFNENLRSRAVIVAC